MSILQTRRWQKADTDLTAVAASGLAAAWTPYTPTVTSGTGTFTSASATGAYVQVGKIVSFRIEVTVTTNGTAATNIAATLPVADVNRHNASGFERALTGKVVRGSLNSGGKVTFLYYDNSYPGADGAIFVLSGVYEAA